MTTIGIITQFPNAVRDYYGFGCEEVERGRNKFGDYAVVCSIPDEHANWQCSRLISGLHGSRIITDLEAWKREWGFEPLPEPDETPLETRRDELDWEENQQRQAAERSA